MVDVFTSLLLLQALNNALSEYEASMLSREHYKSKYIPNVDISDGGANEVTMYIIK